MFIRSYCIYLLLIIIFSFYPTFSMELPLCPIEKNIFLQGVQFIAKEHGLTAVLEQLQRAQEHKKPILLTIKFYKNDIDDDLLTKEVFDIITFKDNAFGYIPYITKKKGRTLPLNGYATNYVGNYTRYWHRTNENGPHILCTSKFTNIQFLRDALAEIEKK